LTAIQAPKPAAQAQENRAADEEVLSEALLKVNTNFEDFFRNSRRPTTDIQ